MDLLEVRQAFAAYLQFIGEQQRLKDVDDVMLRITSLHVCVRDLLILEETDRYYARSRVGGDRSRQNGDDVSGRDARFETEQGQLITTLSRCDNLLGNLIGELYFSRPVEGAFAKYGDRKKGCLAEPTTGERTTDEH